jgi:coiled-coil domain-containing protein 12
MTDRKARLAALSARAGRVKPTESEELSESRDESSSKPSLTTLPTSDDAEPQAKRPKNTNEEKTVLQLALEEARKEAPASRQDLVDVAPKKPNWDLKRDVQKKLDKLERKTQRAIIELLKERLEREAAAEDID